MTYQNPTAALTFYKLNGLAVPIPTVIYPNITTSTCSSGSNCTTGSICTA